MHFSFDSNKDKSNTAKHGQSLGFAEQLAWDEALVWVDPRYPWDEIRMIELVPEGNTLYCVAFTDRGDARGIISLRRADRQEVKRYVENTG